MVLIMNRKRQRRHTCDAKEDLFPAHSQLRGSRKTVSVNTPNETATTEQQVADAPQHEASVRRVNSDRPRVRRFGVGEAARPDLTESESISAIERYIAALNRGAKTPAPDQLHRKADRDHPQRNAAARRQPQRTRSLTAVHERVEERSTETESESDLDQCKVCMSAAIDCVFLDCGHLVCCTQCAAFIKTCPICRESIITVRKVYRT